jgi:hypothetical protein
MWQRHRHAARLLCQILALPACLAASDVRAATCAQIDTVGLGHSYDNNYSDISEGHASGQTFLAADTEIDAITVWRDAIWATDPTPWHIYIMGLDSLGTPDPSKMIQDGPILAHTDGDSIHSTPFRFVFDPPVILPAPGEYELAVMLDQCAPGPSSLNGDYGDGSDYPQGMHWDHGRQVYSCSGHPRSDPTPHPESDLIFTIEFCRASTAVLPSTWGQIKALYR